MKSKVINLTAIALSLLFGIATAQAQTERALASIPFDFQVDTQHMSAGKYAVDCSDGYLLTIRGISTSDEAFVLTNSVDSRLRAQESPRLVFLRSGNQYNLTQVWSPDLQDGRKIPLPKDRQIEVSNAGDNLGDTPGEQGTAIALARH